MTGPRPLAVRAYRALTALLLPPRFRRELGDDMARVFDALHDDAVRAGGPCAGLRVLAGELPGLVRLAVTERLRDRRLAVTSCTTTPEEPDMVESLVHDLRYAVRALRRTPGFTAVAVLTLALGIGANTAIFSVVDAVLLRPLALRAPDDLVIVGEAARGGGPTDYRLTTPGSFFDWQRQASSVRLAGVSGVGGTLTGRGDPERMVGASSIGGLFDVLGVPPLLGRALTVADEDPTSDQVIVLSHATWRRLFGADPAALGRTLMLNGTPRTIVGVMPPTFRFPDGATEFWVPSRFDPEFRANRDQYFIDVVGRLAPGATLERARAEMATIAERLRRDWPTYNSELRLLVFPLREMIVEGVRTRLLVIMGAVGLVLLIACANLGNLLLARASGRRREMAVRQALGARRGRVARQLITESLVLALAGGAAGVLVGKGFLELLLAAQATMNLPRADEIVLDGRVLLFTLGVSVLAGLVFGTIPAAQLARGRSSEALREGARGNTGRSWARGALVVSELALAMVLLTGAGLLLRSFALLLRVDPGFATDRLLTFDATPSTPTAAYYATTLERLRALPGVRSAALVTQLPGSGRGGGAWFNRLDRPLPPNVTPDGEAYRVVSPGYLATVGIPLRRGRLLSDADRAGQLGVVVNEALVRKYYANEDALGKEIYLGAPDNRVFERASIVGVVGDTRDAGPAAEPLPAVYVPQAGIKWTPRFTFVLRTAGEPAALAAAARRVVREVDPTAPVRNVRTVDDVLAEAVAPARWSTALLGVFAGVAVVMAALGVFGVLSFLVAQRARELGIRMALGASPGSVRRLVVGRGLGLVAAGLALGASGAWALSRTMAGLLYGVAPTDPATYGAVAAVLGAVAAAAGWLPARRATRVDPIVTLRAE